MAELIGILRGSATARDVVVRDEVAYIATEIWGLSAVDVSNPAAPVVIGCCNVPFDGYSLVLSGDIACVAGQKTVYSGGTNRTLNVVYFINISNPLKPNLIGRIESFNQRFTSPAISGNYAYVILGLAGVGVYDISNPANPTLVFTYDTPGFTASITVSGNYAYIADGSQGMQIVDITNPSIPTFVSTLSLSSPNNRVDGVVVLGNQAYLVNQVYVTIVDITNKSTPTLQVRYSLPGGRAPVRLKIKSADNMLYASAGLGGLVTLDISNPTSPQVKAIIGANGSRNASTQNVDVDENGVAYIANGFGCLNIVTGANGVSPVQVSTVGKSFESRDKVASRPGLAVICGTELSENGDVMAEVILFIDISDPNYPSEISRFNANGYTLVSPEINGDYLYVSCGHKGLLIFDISDAENPTVVGAFDTPGYNFSAKVSGDYAYLADGTLGMHILNIANPASPVLIGTINTSGNSVSVSPLNGLSYVGDFGSLLVVDTSSKEVPTLLGSYVMPASQSTGEVVARGNIAYVTAGRSGLYLIDVTNPAAPFSRAIVPVSGGDAARTFGVALVNDRAYLANKDGGVGVINIQNPDSPVQIAAVAVPGLAHGVSYEASSGNILSSDTKCGLSIIQP